MLNINGNWNYYQYSLREGWKYPCYFCNTLTSFTIEYYRYRLWTCYNCIDPKISIEKLFRTKIFYSCNIGEYEYASNSHDITLFTSIDTDEEDDI